MEEWKISIIIGVVLIFFPVKNALNVNDYTDQVVVSGIVCDYIDDESTYTKFLIDDCSIVSENSSDNIDYKIIVYS